MLVTHKQRWHLPRCLLAMLFLLPLLTPAHAADLTLTLFDNATGQVAPNTEVYAYRIKDDGEREYAHRRSTDDNGQVILPLEDIENGSPYQFMTKAFNNTRLYSEVAASQTAFTFNVGTKILMLKNGADAANPALANYRLDVKTFREDGRLRGFTSATSDESGLVRLNLAPLESGYVFAARSTTTNEEKRTDVSSHEGTQEFVVGNLPLQVSLVHGITGSILGEQRVEAWRYNADGSRNTVSRRDTNPNGIVVFDLEELAPGERYELYSRNTNNFFATHATPTSGNVTFTFGNTRVRLLNGRVPEQSPHTDQGVTIYADSAAGRERVTSTRSNANGQVLLDLTGFDSGISYVARLKYDGKHYETTIPTSGDVDLVFGRLPQIIAANVSNRATSGPLVGERVDLYRWEGEKRRWAGRGETDANGRVEFDAQGLYEDQVYVLRINPFDGKEIFSDNLTQPTEVDFSVHLVEEGFTAKIKDGSQAAQPAIVGQRINVYQVQGEELKWYTRRDTDEAGMVTFTLPDFDQGQQYVLETRHTQNGKSIKSAPFSSNGQHEFVVGESPVVVTLVNPVTQTPIPESRIDVIRTREDGSRYREARAETDENGQVTFHLTEISETNQAQLKAWSADGFYAEQLISTTGEHTFKLGNTQLTLLNGRVEGNPVLADTNVRIYRVIGEEREKVIDKRSNESGFALLQLPELAAEQFYQAEVRIEKQSYRSDLPGLGASEHIFGLLPQMLSVTVNNTADNTPVVGMRVNILEVTEEKNRHVRSLDTDENGNISTDLQGFYEDKRYMARIKPFDGDYLYSEVVDSPAELSFDIHLEEENFAVTVLDGTQVETTPLGNQRVDVFRLEGDERRWYTRRDTDEDGNATFTLPDLESDQQYVLKTRHSQTNRDVYSEPMSGNGEHEFSVGFAPTIVTLVNPISQAAVEGARVDVLRRKEDGNWRREARAETDENGQVTFHLSEITDESIARLSAYSADGFSSSMEITETGSHQFKLGNTQLTIRNGRVEGNPIIADTHVTLYRYTGEEREKVTRSKTNQNGQVLLDLPEPEENQQYQAVVRVENKNYESMLPSLGDSEHVFGMLPQMVNVRLLNTRDNQPIAGMRIDVREVTEEKHHHRARLTTDDQGMASIDLQGFYEDKKYQLRLRPFDGEYIYSDILTEPKEDLEIAFYYDADGIPVALKDGSSAGQPMLANKRLDIYKVIGEDFKWYARRDTDENGVANFKLPDLDKGQTYVLSAHTSVNNIKRYSNVFGDVDSFEFVLGQVPVNLTLLDAGTGFNVAGQRVEAQRLDEEGKFRWYQRTDTNENGIASFDLEGFGDGAVYRFKTRYLATGDSYSQNLESLSDVTFRVGTVPVQLIDRDSNAPITGIRIDANWLDDDNRQRGERRGDTDAEGNVVFDLNRLRDGTRYVLKAKNPFGENKHYYGPIIYSEGAVQFIVKKGEQGELDLVDPEVLITSPTRDNVNGTGFVLGGTADDDNTLGRVAITISDPVKGVTTGNASLLANNQWQFTVPEAAISFDEEITITATAYDSALNTAAFTRTYNVVTDVEPPAITIISHANNDSVNETGFTILGSATDDTGAVTISASLTDPQLGETITDQSVSVAEDGQWALIVTNGKVSGGETITINLTATDSSDKTAQLSLNLQIQTIVPQQQQLISRITFGMTPDLYVNQPDAATFLTQQLAPADIDDSEVENAAQGWVLEDIDDLKALQMHYMLYSNRQLNEVMTWFWDNHFNTNFNAHRNLAFEVSENQAFRQHALGNFRDLLAASAKSPAMIYYLNNAQNVVGAPNENYAREIMELSSLGVDGGYTAQDIAELAKIFTGWHEQNGEFFFNEEQHDFTDKTFLGVDIPGNGLAEGETALDILATHPNTARNICRKLLTLFVSDSPVNSLQGQCEGQFLASGGDIASVLAVIFGSSEFVALEHQGSKIKTPLEMVLAAIRSVNATPDYDELSRTLSRMGYSLFEFPVPTGLPEVGTDWITSDALLQRIRFANNFALEGDDGASVDLQALLIAMGYSSADAIVGVLADLTLNGRLTDLERDVATALLNENIAEGESFNINSPEAPEKLQRLLGTMLSYPAFQYQ